MLFPEWPIPNGECVGVECKKCGREFIVTRGCPEECLAKVKCLGKGLSLVSKNPLE
jgi:hypothetical protein